MAGRGIHVTINGHPTLLDREEASIHDCIATFSRKRPVLAVFVNDQFVPARTYHSYTVQQGDEIQIMFFLGGG